MDSFEVVLNKMDNATKTAMFHFKDSEKLFMEPISPWIIGRQIERNVIDDDGVSRPNEWFDGWIPIPTVKK